MKKLGLMLVGILTLLLVGCSPQSSPENTAKAYYNALLEENFNDAAKYMRIEYLPKENLVSKMLKDMYSKDDKIVSFNVMGGAYTTNDKAQVAVLYEKAKPAKGENAKDVAILDLVKIDGKWYITQ